MKTFPKPLTAREERECLERLKDGDQEARTALIERNMRLVAHVAKKYQNTDYDMEDLLSVGTIGLIKAVNTFQPDRGPRLATYAAKCVDNAIRSQRDRRRPIKRRMFYDQRPERVSRSGTLLQGKPAQPYHPFRWEIKLPGDGTAVPGTRLQLSVFF